jgi:hypothetical protein
VVLWQEVTCPSNYTSNREVEGKEMHSLFKRKMFPQIIIFESMSLDGCPMFREGKQINQEVWRRG